MWTTKADKIDKCQKIDWADVNGDGRGNLVIVFRRPVPNGKHLCYEVLLSRGIRTLSGPGRQLSSDLKHSGCAARHAWRA